MQKLFETITSTYFWEEVKKGKQFGKESWNRTVTTEIQAKFKVFFKNPINLEFLERLQRNHKIINLYAPWEQYDNYQNLLSFSSSFQLHLPFRVYTFSLLISVLLLYIKFLGLNH